MNSSAALSRISPSGKSPSFPSILRGSALAALYRQNAVELVGDDNWWDSTFGAGSTDMGDISHIMPAIEAQAVGFTGTGHGADYLPLDEETAYITPAKVAAMTLVDLLADGAEIGRAHV